jgi:WD40 repeat protein
MLAPQAAAPRSGLSVTTLLLGGIMLLLGMLVAGGAVYLVMSGKEKSTELARDDGKVKDDSKEEAEPKPPAPRKDEAAPRPTNPALPKEEPKKEETSPTPVTPPPANPTPPATPPTVVHNPPSAPAQPPGLLKGHTGGVAQLRFSHDGTKLGAVGKNALLWNLRTGESIPLVEDAGKVDIVYAKDGNSLLIGSLEKVSAFDPASGAGLASFGSGTPYYAAAISANGKTAVTTSRDARGYHFHIWDVASKQEVLTFEPGAKTSGSYHLAVSPDGKTVAFESNKDVRLFDVEGKREMQPISGASTNGVEDLQFAADGRHLLIQAQPYEPLTFWDVSDRAGKPRLKQQLDRQKLLYPGDVRRFEFSPDGSLLALSTYGRLGSKLNLWEVATWKQQTVVDGGYPMRFSADGSRVAAWGPDNKVLAAETSTGKTIQVLDGPWSAMDLSPDGKTLALGKDDGTIHLKPIGGGAGGFREVAVLPFESREREEYAISFSRDGRFAMASELRSIRAVQVYDAIENKFIKTFPSINTWSMLPDNKTLVTFEYSDTSSARRVDAYTDLLSGRRQAITILNAPPKTSSASAEYRPYDYYVLLLAPDAQSYVAFIRGPKPQGNQLVLLNPNNAKITSVLSKDATVERAVIAPDSKLLATTDSGYRVRLWDLVTKQEKPCTFGGARNYMAFADNGGSLASADTYAAQVLDIASGVEKEKIDLNQGHTGQVRGVAFSPVDPIMATVGDNGEVLLKSRPKGDVRARLLGHTGKVLNAGFSPDGKLLATVGEEKTLRLWSVGALPPPGSDVAMPDAPTTPRPTGGISFQPREHAALPIEVGGDYDYFRFSRDGNLMWKYKDPVGMWDLAAGKQVFNNPGGKFGSFRWYGTGALSPDGRTVLARSHNYEFVAVDLHQGESRPGSVRKGFHGNATYSPDGKSIAIGLKTDESQEGKILAVVDAETFAERAAISGFDANVSDVAYTPDGATLLAIIHDREGRRLAKLDPQTLAVRGVIAEVGSKELWLSPDGKTVAAYQRDKNSSYGPLAFWDVASGRKLSEIIGAPGVRHLTWVANLPQVMIGDGAYRVTIYDVNNGQARQTLDLYNAHLAESKVGYTPWDIAVSADRRYIATGGGNGNVFFWDLTQGRVVGKFKAHPGIIYGLAFSPNGKYLITTGEEKKLKIWALDPAQPPVTLKPESPPPMPPPMDQKPADPKPTPPSPPTTPNPPAPNVPSAPGLNVGSGKGQIALRDVGPGLKSLGELDGGVYTLAYSPDGKHLAAMTHDQVIRLMNLETKQYVTLGAAGGLGKPRFTVGLTFLPDGKHLAGLTGEQLTIWDYTGKQVRSLDHKDWLIGVAAKAGVLVTASQRVVTVWDAATWNKKHEIPVAQDLSCLTLTHDGAQIFAASEGVLHVWDAATGQRKFERPFKASDRDVKTPVVSMAVSPDNKDLAVALRSPNANYPCALQLFNVADATNQNYPLYAIGSHDVGAISYSKDGTLTLAHEYPSRKEHRLTFHDVMGKKERFRRELPAGLVHTLAYSPDGQSLAYAGESKDIHVLDLSVFAPSRPIAVFQQGQTVSALAFGPGNRVLAVAGKDAKNQGELRLWEYAKLESVNLVENPKGVQAFHDVKFTLDGKTLAAAGGLDGKSVHFWDAGSKGATNWVAPMGLDFKPERLALAPDGSKWAVYGRFRSGDISRIYVVEKGKEKTPVQFDRFGPELAVSADKTIVAACGRDTVHMYAAATGQEQAPLMRGGWSMACTSDGAKLAVLTRSLEDSGGGGLGATDPIVVVKVFDFATTKVDKKYSAPLAPETTNISNALSVGANSAAAGFAVAINDKSVAAAVIEIQGPKQLLSIKIWDRDSGSLRRSYMMPADPGYLITSLSLSQDNKTLAIGGQQLEKPGSYTTVGRVMLWAVE